MSPRSLYIHLSEDDSRKAERLAKAFFEARRPPYTWDDLDTVRPGAKNGYLTEAREWVRAANFAGLALVEAEDGR
jgi:hypothetical protein